MREKKKWRLLIEWIHLFLIKDTVAAYEEDNKINAGEYADTGHAAISLNTDVHHSVPVLAG